MSVVGLLNIHAIIREGTLVLQAALLSITFWIMFGDALRLVLECTIFWDAFFWQQMSGKSLCVQTLATKKQLEAEDLYKLNEAGCGFPMFVLGLRGTWGVKFILKFHPAGPGKKIIFVCFRTALCCSLWGRVAWKATFNVPEEESIDDKMASKCVAQVHEDCSG